MILLGIPILSKTILKLIQMEENRFLDKPEVKVSLYLLPFWRYKRFKILGFELSSTTSGHRIDSR